MRAAAGLPDPGHGAAGHLFVEFVGLEEIDHEAKFSTRRWSTWATTALGVPALAAFVTAAMGADIKRAEPGMMGPGMMGQGMGPGKMTGQGRGPGMFLMSTEERDAFRQRMQDAKTSEERNAIRAEMHDRMQDLAKEKGVTLPQGQMGPGPDTDVPSGERWRRGPTGVPR